MVGVVSHGLAVGGLLALLVLLAIGWRRSGPGLWLIGATVVTLAWALVEVASAYFLGGLRITAGAFEIARSTAWIGFIVSVLGAVGLDRGRSATPRILVAASVTIGVASIALDVGLWMRMTPGIAMPVPSANALGHLGLAVVGLALVENLYRPLDAGARWRIKFLCFGLGGLFAYDLFFYAHVLLFHALDLNLLAARGLVTLMVVPFLAVTAARNTDWKIDIGVSRATVFHTAALVGTGTYLIGMAAAGYYIREFGGTWGGVLRAAFLFGSVAVLAVALSSAALRSRVRVFVSKHFFSYKYDYRDIWRRFIEALTSADPGVRLEDRVVRAVADVVDSPDGALWIGDDEGVYRLAAEWNMGRWRLPQPHDLVQRASTPMVEFLRAKGLVIVVADVASRPEFYGELRLAPWLAAAERAWIVLPLALMARLVGFVVLGQPRAPRDLNWEDFDLLRTIGSQAASYLAEQNATRALGEAREFESFSRRFAFVVHDVKNLASQLSLLAGNAAKHGHDAAYREDMIATMHEAIGKLNRLLARLRETDAADSRHLALAPFLRNVLTRWQGSACAIEFDVGHDDETTAAVDVERLRTVMNHLIQNAVDAALETAGRVTVRLTHRADAVVIDVIDTGPGMTAEFARDQLFRPFQSTKLGGYGIGTYESRALLQEMGAGIEVITAPGQGTTMRVTLPLAEASRPAAPSSAA